MSARGLFARQRVESLRWLLDLEASVFRARHNWARAEGRSRGLGVEDWDRGLGGEGRGEGRASRLELRGKGLCKYRYLDTCIRDTGHKALCLVAFALHAWTRPSQTTVARFLKRCSGRRNGPF